VNREKANRSSQVREAVTMKSLAKINEILKTYRYIATPFPQGKPTGMWICIFYQDPDHVASTAIGSTNLECIFEMAVRAVEKSTGCSVCRKVP
jgi:hypothetical protein